MSVTMQTIKNNPVIKNTATFPILLVEAGNKGEKNAGLAFEKTERKMNMDAKHKKIGGAKTIISKTYLPEKVSVMVFNRAGT